MLARPSDPPGPGPSERISGIRLINSAWEALAEPSLLLATEYALTSAGVSQ